MAPSKTPQPPYSKDERVLCFHMEMLYEAKILDVQPTESGDGWSYKIHYKGWKSSWDDWVPQDRIRKLNDENKDLAQQLLAQYKQLQSGKTAKQPKGKGGRGGPGGSDLSSARGSEERTGAAGGGGSSTQNNRNPRRARDFDLETVSVFSLLFLLLHFLLLFWSSFLGVTLATLFSPSEHLLFVRIFEISTFLDREWSKNWMQGQAGQRQRASFYVLSLATFYKCGVLVARRQQKISDIRRRRERVRGQLAREKKGNSGF